MIANKIQYLNYTEKDIVATHGNNLVGNCPSLQASTDYYTRPNGHKVHYLKFAGTVPVFIKGNTYNIPVTIWLDYSYPNTAPIVMVTPTANMAIAPQHRHVDQTGRVYLPYLHQWNRRCELVFLIGELTTCFSKASPVYAKPANQYNPPAQTYHQPARPVQYNQPQQHAYNPPPSYSQQPPPTYGQHQQQNVANKYQQEQQKKQEEAMRAAQKRSECETRMKTLIKTEFDKVSNDIQQTTIKQKKMERKGEKITAMLEQSEVEYGALETRKGQLGAEITAIETWLAENEHSATIDVDNVVSAADTHSEQLFEETANDYGVTDVLYELDQALADELINLPQYLKQIRKLSRKQFEARALSKKLEHIIGGARQSATRPNLQQRPPPSYQNVPPPSYR